MVSTDGYNGGEVQELASALAYLHRQGVVHGDVKGANMLVSRDIKILLCDFGLAKIIGSTTSTSCTGLGTLRWQAPELWDDSPKTYKSDVYAFGFTVYEVSLVRYYVQNLAAYYAVPFKFIRS